MRLNCNNKVFMVEWEYLEMLKANHENDAFRLNNYWKLELKHALWMGIHQMNILMCAITTSYNIFQFAVGNTANMLKLSCYVTSLMHYEKNLICIRSVRF